MGLSFVRFRMSGRAMAAVYFEAPREALGKLIKNRNFLFFFLSSSLSLSCFLRHFQSVCRKREECLPLKKLEKNDRSRNQHVTPATFEISVERSVWKRDLRMNVSSRIPSPPGGGRRLEVVGICTRISALFSSSSVSFFSFLFPEELEGKGTTFVFSTLQHDIYSD